MSASVLYHTSPAIGLAGVFACAYLRTPPATMLPVIATSPPMVAEPITPKLATLPNAPFSMVNPPTTALAPVVIMLPPVMLKPVPVIAPFNDVSPPAEKYAPLAVKLPPVVPIPCAVRYPPTLAFEYVPK